MSDQQNWNDIGKQLRDAVQGALVTGDFKEMNQIVSESVNKAVAEAKRQAGQAMEEAKKQAGQTMAEARKQAEQARAEAKKQTAQATFKETKTAAYSKKQLPRIKTKKVGNVAGVLLTVFGGIGTGCASIAVLVAIILFAKGAVLPLIWALAFLFGFIFMIDRGCMRRNRIKRAERYVALCGGKSYIDIEELALQMGKSRKHILKDVKKMIKLGIFPEGHLDAQESCLILDDATFREYLKLQKERKALEMEAKVARMQEKQKANGAYAMHDQQAGNEDAKIQAGQIAGGQHSQSDSRMAGSISDDHDARGLVEAEGIDDPELAALIKEGNDCIRKLRKMNDDIEGEAVSAKLSQLENLLQEIFDRVKEHPEQMPQMQKFMNYYLPTTLKLVEAYGEFDDVSVPGEDIALAKLEIEKTLDTINQAFAELLNKLFRSSVYDVTTDAQVLQTMLAKEGLTGNKEFEKLSR